MLLMPEPNARQPPELPAHEQPDIMLTRGVEGIDDQYQQIPNQKGRSGKFHIQSNEIIPCPVCGCELFVIGTRKRRIVHSAGEKQTLVIRRLRCRECGIIHHELPSIIRPYKRRCAETCEKIIAGGIAEVYCESSTIRRIKAWWVASPGSGDARRNPFPPQLHDGFPKS